MGACTWTDANRELKNLEILYIFCEIIKKKIKMNHSLSCESPQEQVSSHTALSEGKIWHLQDCFELSKEICPDKLNRWAKVYMQDILWNFSLENSSTEKMNSLAKLCIPKTNKRGEKKKKPHTRETNHKTARFMYQKN